MTEEVQEESFVGMMILCHNDGVPCYTMDFPWPEGQLETMEASQHSYVVTPIRRLDQIWVDGDTVRERTEGPWTASSTNVPVGEYFELSNLPVGAVVSVGPTDYQIEDGEFGFLSGTPGKFVVRVAHWPFFDATYEVTFA